MTGGRGLQFERGPRVRTWGGWYRHTRVMLDGRHVGTIQARRRNGRLDTITIVADGKTCVLGHDVVWLVRMAHEETRRGGEA